MLSRIVFFVILICLAFSHSRGEQIMFESGLDFYSDNASTSVMSGDLNGDGHPDIAVANSSAHSISVLLNNGEGFFGELQSYESDGRPNFIYAADLDDDKDLDVAVTNYDSDELAIFLNNGDGSFVREQLISTPPSPHRVCLADLSGDSLNDIAFICRYVDSVFIMLNQGVATFSAPVAYAVGNRPMSLVARDLNGDASADLVVANSWSDDLSILLNNGDGSFAGEVLYPFGDSPIFVTVADFDGDSLPDIAGTNSQSYDFSVLFNEGDGAFSEAEVCSTGWRTYPGAICSNDVDGDGDQDLAVACDNHTQIHLNDGMGAFTLAHVYNLVSPTSLAFSDLNADGHVDLIGCRGAYTKVLYNDGGGHFRSAKRIPFHHPMSAVVGEFDGDGRVDLAVAEGYVDSVAVLFNVSGGNFTEPVRYATGPGPGLLVAADVNRDDRLDLITLNENMSISVLLNEGTGTYSPAQNYEYPYELGTLFAAEVNNAVGMDLIFAASEYPVIFGYLPNDGLGHFGPARLFHSCDDYSGFGKVAAADLNDDGDCDVVAACTGPPGSVTILLNNGYGMLHSEFEYDIDSPRLLAVGDLDGDQDIDLSVAHLGLTEEDHLQILLNNGDASMQFGENLAIQTFPLGLVAFDIDQDGDLDLGTTGQDGNIRIYLNDGKAHFQRQSQFEYAAGLTPSCLVSADIDIDGMPDLLTANSFSEDVTILFSQLEGGYICGDADGNGFSNISDAVYIISYIFGGGSPPDPLLSGDSDCNQIVNISDAVYLLGYIFGGGAAPCAACP
jgi:hypothetical protein